MKSGSNSFEIWQKIVAQAWKDESFKKELFNHPEQILKQEGIELPKGAHVKILENSGKEFYLVFPEKPKGNLKDYYAASSVPPHCDFMG